MAKCLLDILGEGSEKTEFDFLDFCIWVKHFLLLVSSNFLSFGFSLSPISFCSCTDTPHPSFWDLVILPSIFVPECFIRHWKGFYLGITPPPTTTHAALSVASPTPKGISLQPSLGGHSGSLHITSQLVNHTSERKHLTWRPNWPASAYLRPSATLHALLSGLWTCFFMHLDRGLIMCH